MLQDLLGTPAGAAAAWAHFIAFDLFVGRWMYRDSRARGINGWLMGPVLLFTILLAPLGLLGYFGLRAIPRSSDRSRVDSRAPMAPPRCTQSRTDGHCPYPSSSAR